MTFQVSEGMDRGIRRNDQTNGITLEDRRDINDMQIFAACYEFLIARGKDKVVVTQHHRTDEIVDHAMMEGHIEAGCLVIAFALRDIKWGKLNVRYVT